MSGAGEGPESEADLRRLAARRVAARQGFFAHATVYVFVNGFLVCLNWFTSPGHWWVVWPIFGWGVGLAAHGVSVFSYLAGDQERAIQDEMARLRRRRG